MTDERKRKREPCCEFGGNAGAVPIAVRLRDVIIRLAMKPSSALILFLSASWALPCGALRLQPVPNPTAEPLPVVDIEDAGHMVVAHLFVLPGETMKLDSKQVPAAGAGYYEAMPGEDYILLIFPKMQFPRLGKEVCPCALHMDKIGWNRQGEVATVAGLRPYLETASGARIPIVSDVKHVRIAGGKFYFKLQGRSGDYWALTRFGQVVETGGPWGLAEMMRFFFFVLLPLTLAVLLGIMVVGAIHLMREDTHPDKSFIELMEHTFMCLPLVSRIGRGRQRGA